MLLSSNSKWLLVVLHIKPSMFSMFLVDAWRQCGDMRDAHSISVYWGDEPKLVVFNSNSNTTSKYASHEEENHWFCIQNNQWKIIVDQLPTKSPFELKNDCIVTAASIGSFTSQNMTIWSLLLIPYLGFCNDYLINNKMCLMTLEGFLQ